MNEFIIAFALITSGVEIDDDLDYIKSLREPLILVSIRLEIMDEREWAVTSPYGDISLSDLQERYKQYLNYPKIEDTGLFPNRQIIDQFLSANRMLRNNLLKRKEIDLVNAETIERAIEECDTLYHIWDLARDASTTYYYNTIRRESLNTLRDMIGPENYYRGRMPPPYPYWHISKD